MAKKLSPQLKKARAKFKAQSTIILTQAANEAVNFFKDNFRRGGFFDRRLNKWDPRKKEDKTFKKKGTKRGILVKSGTLKNSINRTGLSSKRATIGIKSKKASKYASVHNFGLRSGRPKGGSFIMPKRQFMGESHELNKKISRLIQKRVKKIL